VTVVEGRALLRFHQVCRDVPRIISAQESQSQGIKQQFGKTSLLFRRENSSCLTDI
jgi:hypothetical protein